MGKYFQSASHYIEWSKTALDLDRKARSARFRIVKRGHVYWCNFGINIGSEQEELRPCVVLQHRDGNKTSPNTIVAPITHTNSTLDVVVPIIDKHDASGQLILDGHVLLGNIVTISKSRLGDEITKLTSDEMSEIDEALAKSIDLFWKFEKYKRLLADKDSHINKLKSKIKEKDDKITILEEKIANIQSDEGK